MNIKKPMLAHTIEDTSKIDYPCYASPKLDGIRAMVIDEVVYSRSMKPIRSKAVQDIFGKPEYNGFDGELLYGEWNAPDVFNMTTQTVMSTEIKEGFKQSDINYAVFDLTDCEDGTGYTSRNSELGYIVNGIEAKDRQIKLVQKELCQNEAELLSFEKRCLEFGYEGIMISSVHGRYKQGRSTLKEGLLGKLKRFSDDEAIVTGFQEKMTNTNDAKTNEVGRSQRSQSQNGMVGASTLGAIECECKGIKFTMGSGFNDALRAEVWANKDKYLGKLAKFKHFEIGKKDSYRFPIFLGFRDKDDI